MAAFFFFLLTWYCYTASVSSYTPSLLLNRRTLHQSLFPLISQPPANPPSPSPLPKYPSSTTPLPFFPSFPSPPPPPSPPATSSSPSLPNIPANISSLVFPISSSSPPPSNAKKLVLSIALPILSLALLGLALVFFLRCRRHHASGKSSRTESDRLFPANAVASDGGRKLSDSSGPAGSEFLFLGTVVNSRGDVGEGLAAAAPPSADPSYRRLDSPELQPLPPLSRHVRQVERHPEPCCSSEEEFYSPRVSSDGKENPGGDMGAEGSASRRGVPAPVMEKCGSDNSTLSAPSYPSSDSASSLTRSLSSPSSASTPEESTDGGATADAALRSPTPPQPPRTTTHSPPTRKSPSPSPSPPSSPLQEDSNLSLVPPQPPPRPPPPPPGFSEPKTSKVLPCEPPALGSPRTTGLRSTAAVHPADSPKNSDAGLKDGEEPTPRPKLKPLHWDKVRASSNREMAWDLLKSSSFQLNEEMIETLFVCKGAPKEAARWPVSSPDQENWVLDPKKSQNIAILLRALNLTKEEVCEALTEGNTDSLGTELLQTLLKMAPSKEEELKLKEYKDGSTFKLYPAEIFLKAVLDIPFAFKRVEAMLYIANFESEINYLRKSFETLQTACEELRSSRIFMKLLEAVLKTGNRMNVGTNRGDARAFKLDTLLKLVDIKGADGKTTLLHFVVQEITRAEGTRLAAANHTISSGCRSHTCTLEDDLEFRKLGLVVVAGLGGELSNVKKAAAMDSEVLTGYVSKLSRGISRVDEAVKLNGPHTAHERGRRFHDAMFQFLKEAQEEILRIQSQEHIVLSSVKETTEYFHGNVAEEEAHPFRIFLIVRDFLSILHQVCMEVGKVNERTMVGAALQQLPLPGNPILPALFPKLRSNMAETSDEDDSSLSC